MIGDCQSMLLGPLTVKASYKGQGLGRLLLMTVAAKASALGIASILLVGDHPYYGPHGYRQVPHGQITLPGPVDPDRLLILTLLGDGMPAGAVTGGYGKSALVSSKQQIEPQLMEMMQGSAALAT